MHRSLRALSLLVVLATPTAVQAQAALPNKAFAAITGPIEKNLSGERAFATVGYVASF